MLMQLLTCSVMQGMHCCLVVCLHCLFVCFLQGAKKTGTAPDGRSYLDSAEDDDIKALLK